MSARVQKTKTRTDYEEFADEYVRKPKDYHDYPQDYDPEATDILDYIDALLEELGEDFAENYVQRGGE